MYAKLLTDSIQVYGAIEFLNIKALGFCATVNQHAKLWVEGYIDNETASRVETQKLIGEKCGIINIKSEEIIFEGVYQDILLTYQNELVAIKWK